MAPISQTFATFERGVTTTVHGESPVTRLALRTMATTTPAAPLMELLSCGAHVRTAHITNSRGNQFPIRLLEFSEDNRWLAIHTSDPADRQLMGDLSFANGVYLIDLDKLN